MGLGLELGLRGSGSGTEADAESKRQTSGVGVTLSFSLTRIGLVCTNGTDSGFGIRDSGLVRMWCEDGRVLRSGASL